MTKGRKTTLDERIEIVSYCMEHGKDYQLTCQKYAVSYNQLYSWVRKYEEKGIEGLVDNRGRKKPESEMDENDRLRAENRLLQAENRRLEVELAIIKKIRGNRKEATLSGVRQEDKYLVIVELNDGAEYTVAELCRALSLNPSSYYKMEET